MLKNPSIKLQKYRNPYKSSLYKSLMGICCNPECQSNYGIHVHHIVPLYANGVDAYRNFVCLCSYCHTHMKNHSDFEMCKLTLLTWKIFAETKILGFSSIDFSDKDFHAECLKSSKLARKSERNLPVISENKVAYTASWEV